MAIKGASPLELLVQQMERIQEDEASIEHELESLPRWRFRRRLEAERTLERNRERRARMQELLEGGREHS